MMFVLHMSAALAYMALTVGAALVIWSMRNKGAGSGLGTFIGSIVIIASLLSILCIGYYGTKYWLQGDFEHLSPMYMKGHEEMMKNMMPMMQGKMMENMGKMGGMGKMGMEMGKGPAEEK